MDEIRQVEIELKRLREEADHQKAAARSLHKENVTLKSRNEYLLNKLKEASYVYGEAGKRLLYFINNQVNPVVERLNNLESGAKKLGSADKTLAESIVALNKLVKENFDKLDAKINALAKGMGETETRLRSDIKGSKRKTELGDADLEEKLLARAADFDKELNSLRVSMERKNASRMAGMEKRVNEKMNMLREQGLLMGKDIEALKRFEADIEGVDGRLQETISHLTQTRLDMEKVEQRVKNAMSRTKSDLKRGMEKLSAGFDSKLLEFSSDLRRTDEKNLGTIRLEAKENQQGLNKQLETFKSGMSSFERSVNGKLKNSESTLKKELGSFSSDMEERLRLLESGINSNKKSQRDAKKAVSEKISSLEGGIAQTSGEVRELLNLKSQLTSLVKQAGQIQARIEKTEAVVAKDAEAFKDRFEKNSIIIKNELENIDKKIDQRVSAISSELVQQNSVVTARMREEFISDINSIQQKLGLVSKDVANMKAFEADIKNLASAIKKREESAAELEAKMNAVYQDIKDKSERDDMRLKKELEVLEAQIKNSLDTAESRMVKENVRAFSAAKLSLRKDIHAIREENAALKAEIKGLKALSGVVSELQHGVLGMEKRVDDFSHALDKVSAGARAKVENEALRVGKEIAGIAAKLKSDMRDLIATEKEKFARQSTDLNNRYENLANAVADAGKKMEDLFSRSERNKESYMTNKKKLGLLDKEVDKVLKEIVSWKKEYKLELGKLLKEIEG